MSARANASWSSRNTFARALIKRLNPPSTWPRGVDWSNYAGFVGVNTSLHLAPLLQVLFDEHLDHSTTANGHSGKGKRRRFEFVKCSCSYCSVLNATNSDNPALNIVGAHRPEKPDRYTAIQPPSNRWVSLTTP